jgi:hypothetical protein
LVSGYSTHISCQPNLQVYSFTFASIKQISYTTSNLKKQEKNCENNDKIWQKSSKIGIFNIPLQISITYLENKCQGSKGKG